MNVGRTPCNPNGRVFPSACTHSSRSLCSPYQKKKRTHIKEVDDPAKKGQPRSFVLRRGRHANLMKDLEQDLRKLMSPNTATGLKQHRKNVLKDFVHVAGPLGVTHFLLLSATEHASYLRIGKSPRGPTVTFKIHEYSLMRDVAHSMQRPRCPQQAFLHHPLVVMNQFNQEPHLKLVSVMFQNMFPTINVTTTRLATCQRVLLLEYSSETERITVRQYSIAVKATGVAKNLKKLLDRRGDAASLHEGLGKLTDISELMTKSGYGSESEGEEAEASKVELEQRGTRQSRIKLTEIGPRMELEVIKIEEGLCEGKVLYHRYEERTEVEVREKDDEIAAANRLKSERRRVQDENVRKKQALQKAKDEAKKDNKERKKKEWWEKNADGDEGAGRMTKEDRDKARAQEDIEYYKQEVGEFPDEEFLARDKNKGRGGSGRGGSGRGGSGRGGGRSMGTRRGASGGSRR